MPRKLPTPCNYPGCPNLSHERYCEKHKRQEAKRYDQQRGTAAQRGYDSRWRKIRAMVLAEEPLCRECARQGRVVPAQHIDHIDGNVNDMSRENLQPLCASCHSRKTARENGRWGTS